MGRAFETITDPMRDFIESQHVFFVATAPSEGGHVNLSPKGYDSFRLLGANRVAYLDLTGSGAETIAHVGQNGRITVMFCAFEGKPN
ncbi:MAG: pyridoxamine 5'-phosphate oxidase family protein, partial [Ilumatobacter sp.]|uniref:pyridoxamine 5'-phosphate oxidase family protein n=1 Tax=Ilumatobacter sp. TaxID=1967498 RepID=UPI00262A5006